MKISIVCSSNAHPVYAHLARWRNEHVSQHDIALVTRVADLGAGDLLFLISCSEIVGADVRGRFRHSLLVHASALPQGRGWSPQVWQILEGRNRIPLTLLEAADRVDTGAIWAQRAIELEGHELYDEINAKLFAATLSLVDFAVHNAAAVRPRPQEAGAATYYRRRTPEDSRLSPEKTIAEQFDLLRVADPERFPCFFDLRGKRYQVVLQKKDIP